MADDEVEPEQANDEFALNIGHQGVGDNCLDKVINYAGKSFLAGNSWLLVCIIWSDPSPSVL